MNEYLSECATYTPAAVVNGSLMSFYSMHTVVLLGVWVSEWDIRLVKMYDFAMGVFSTPSHIIMSLLRGISRTAPSDLMTCIVTPVWTIHHFFFLIVNPHHNIVPKFSTTSLTIKC